MQNPLPGYSQNFPKLVVHNAQNKIYLLMSLLNPPSCGIASHNIL